MATASGSERLGRRWMGRAPNAHHPWLKPAKTPEDGRYHEDRGSTWEVPARSWVLPHLPLPTGKSNESTERKGFRPSRVVCTLSRRVTRPEGSSPPFSPAASPSPTPGSSHHGCQISEPGASERLLRSPSCPPLGWKG